MDSALMPPLPAGLMSAATRDLAVRAVQLAAAAQLRWPSRPAAAVPAAVLAAWLVNSIDWVHCDVRLLVAVCSGSVVATLTLAAGWAVEPEELERWALRALLAALGSALPTLISA